MPTDTKTKCEQQIIQSRNELKQLLASLSEEQWQTPIISENQTWTMTDIVAHLLENEIGMSIHVHKIRQGRETVPEGFELDEWNAGLKKRMGNPGREELLEKLDQARAKTLEVLRSIKDDEWNLQGRHPLHGIISIEQYYETMAGHDRWHAGDIKRALGL